MSLPAREIARIMSKGMTNGKYNDLLAMEKLEHNCLITTSGYDSLTTDSANSASAYATGHKSVVNAMGVYADSTKDPFDDPRVENLSEILKRTRGIRLAPRFLAPAHAERKRCNDPEICIHGDKRAALRAVRNI